ncbi:MAG TPA: class I adenylate-forming enzyme family protein [Candidatus Dormibacteraeota bacterium]|nr:class I adenylate-forming enzyme family protein [Candidatus Dormibacteraeota bacterium]
MLTLAALPWTAALRAPSAPALHSDRGTLDFAALDRAASGVAARLARRGIAARDRVAICCGNGLAFPVLYYGALRAGAVVVLLPTTAPPAALAGTIRRLRVRLVAADTEHAAQARQAVRQAGTGAAQLVLRGDSDADRPARSRGELHLDTLVDHPSTTPHPVDPATPAVILNTSGTTGVPRGALHSHAGLLLNARAVAAEMLHLDERDVQLGALPMPHSFGMSAVLNASVLAGASVALMPRFDPDEALRTIAERRVTVLQGVPTMFSRLVSTRAAQPASQDRTPLPSLRLTVVSGAPLPAGLAAGVHRHLCRHIVERWGMTEVSPLTMREVPEGDGEPGDVGRPLWGVAVRASDSGELEAAAPSMFLGYAGDTVASRAAMHDGFLRTGDLGRVDRDGRVVLTGRLKDLIIRGGNNVAAREVEHVLEGHPAVLEVAVVGLPDPDMGEEVAAALVLEPGTPPGIAGELRRRCAEHLAAHKRPRHWYVLDQLPRTASGKVRKGELRDALLTLEPLEAG